MDNSSSENPNLKFWVEFSQLQLYTLYKSQAIFYFCMRQAQFLGLVFEQKCLCEWIFSHFCSLPFLWYVSLRPLTNTHTGDFWQEAQTVLQELESLPFKIHLDQCFNAKFKNAGVNLFWPVWYIESRGSCLSPAAVLYLDTNSAEISAVFRVKFRMKVTVSCH